MTSDVAQPESDTVDKATAQSASQTGPASLILEVVTYSDLSQRPELIFTLIERVLAELVPNVVQWRVTHWPEGRATRVSRQLRLFPGSTQWGYVRDLIYERKPGTLLFVASVQSPLGELTSAVSLTVRVAKAYWQWQGHPKFEVLPVDPREAKYFSFSADTRVWPGGITTSLQDRLVALAVELFTSLEAACGFVDLRHDRVTVTGQSLTEYEERIGYADGPFRRRLWREVRGAFWANLLSSYHVARLGGTDNVLSHAPCAVARPIGAGDERAGREHPVYLQLTHQLAAPIPEQRYRQLESFLAPILVSVQDQRGYVILAAEYAQSLDGERVASLFAGSVRRATRLPDSALLLEYNNPDGWPAAYNALRRLGVTPEQNCRSIPQLRSLRHSDEVSVSTSPGRVLRRPSSGPILPAIVVQPYILSDEVSFRVQMAEVPSSQTAAELTLVVENWAKLGYMDDARKRAISACSVPQRKGDTISWQANLFPVGQDAYFQLVLMLDEFSRTKERLIRVDVGPTTSQSGDHT